MVYLLGYLGCASDIPRRSSSLSNFHSHSYAPLLASSSMPALFLLVSLTVSTLHSLSRLILPSSHIPYPTPRNAFLPSFAIMISCILTRSHFRWLWSDSISPVCRAELLPPLPALAIYASMGRDEARSGVAGINRMVCDRMRWDGNRGAGSGTEDNDMSDSSRSGYLRPWGY